METDCQSFMGEKGEQNQAIKETLPPQRASPGQPAGRAVAIVHMRCAQKWVGRFLTGLLFLNLCFNWSITAL